MRTVKLTASDSRFSPFLNEGNFSLFFQLFLFCRQTDNKVCTAENIYSDYRHILCQPLMRSSCKQRRLLSSLQKSVSDLLMPNSDINQFRTFIVELWDSLGEYLSYDSSIVVFLHY